MKENQSTKRLKHLILIVALAAFATSCKELNKNSNQEKKEVDNEQVEKRSSIKKTILFFGNSLTAGYGLEPSQSFPTLIQQKLDSANFRYKVVNAGVSGETSAGGNGRVDWILKQPVDVFVLELGANDGLRGIAVNETKKNLQAIIDKVRKKYPAVKMVLAGMQVPPNMGSDYSNKFKALYPDLAKKNNITLIPFLLEGVGGIRDFNQADGIHPTAEGAKIVAQNVWQVLKDVVAEDEIK